MVSIEEYERKEKESKELTIEITENENKIKYIEEYSKLSDEINGIKAKYDSDISTINHSIEKVRSEINARLSEYQTLDSESTKLTEEINQLQNEMNEKITELSKIEESIQNYHRENEILSKKVDKYNELYKKLKEAPLMLLEYFDLESVLIGYTERYERLKYEIENVKSERNNLDVEYEEKEQLKNAHISNNENLKNRFIELERMVNEKNELQKNLNGRIRIIESECSTINEKKHVIIETYDQKINDQKSKNEALKEKLNELDKKIGNFVQTRRAELLRIDTKINKNIKLEEELSKKRDQLRKDIMMRFSHDAVSDLSKKIEEQFMTLQNAKVELNKAKEKHSKTKETLLRKSVILEILERKWSNNGDPYTSPGLQELDFIYNQTQMENKALAEVLVTMREDYSIHLKNYEIVKSHLENSAHEAV